ncbi:hypothetical protein RJ55_07593 [Drechmeria coniospora]|nr:hypothetical protein RJ55_07593 [Drechmeria coniospora]
MHHETLDGFTACLHCHVTFQMHRTGLAEGTRSGRKWHHAKTQAVIFRFLASSKERYRLPQNTAATNERLLLFFSLARNVSSRRAGRHEYADSSSGNHHDPSIGGSASTSASAQIQRQCERP